MEFDSNGLKLLGVCMLVRHRFSSHSGFTSTIERPHLVIQLHALMTVLVCNYGFEESIFLGCPVDPHAYTEEARPHAYNYGLEEHVSLTYGLVTVHYLKKRP